MCNKCSVSKCKKDAYKDGDMCRIHQSEVRMFGRVRDAGERTAKTAANKSTLRSGEFSKFAQNLNSEWVLDASLDIREKEKRNQARNHFRKYRRGVCAVEGCDNSIILKNKALIYCYDHRHVYKENKIAVGEALMAIDARKGKKA